MFSSFQKILAMKPAAPDEQSTKAPLFAGSAYFSNRVPHALIEGWVAQGGQVSSRINPQAKYFFATDTADEWASTLTARSVTVIHAGWIEHCIGEGFQVPITNYVLDAIPPTDPNEADIPIIASEPAIGAALFSDPPSTPPNAPRKRKREQAYFDSPSGSLVFSGFDKDGVPRRPKKQRMLRFDPSFTPEGTKPNKKAKGATRSSLPDNHDPFGDDGTKTGNILVQNVFVSDSITAEAPPESKEPIPNHSTTNQPSSTNGAHTKSLTFDSDFPSQALGPQPEKREIVRTIDFTNLPPSTKQISGVAIKSRGPGMTTSIFKKERKVKTLRKITFAEHALVRLYEVPIVEDNIEATQHSDVLCTESDTTQSSNDGSGSAQVRLEDPTTISHLPLAVEPPDIATIASLSVSGTVTLDFQQVQATRERLLSVLDGKSGFGGGQLATLFELGKRFKGMEFRHVW
ncbi:hypothetical protein HYDPIDRAFT_167150 [Hydnomerulius pinastri MD-312]|nr:hypothetical protein HYDPIDRAFT_167150 [Hydnomerulius pinastri MD-312]